MIYDFFLGVINYPVTLLRMRDKCKIIKVQRNAKRLWYNYHGLSVRTYITCQQSYLAQINTRQIRFEACFDNKRDCDLDKRNSLMY